MPAGAAEAAAVVLAGMMMCRQSSGDRLTRMTEVGRSSAESVIEAWELIESVVKC